MDNFVELIKREFILILQSFKRKCILVALITFGICFSKAYYTISSCYGSNENLVFDLFKGEGYIIDMKEFSFPLAWFLCNIAIIYFIGQYLYKDYKFNGLYVIIRSSKERYWIAKILCSITMIIIYYIIIFGFAYLCQFLVRENTIINFEMIILYTTTSIMLVIVSNLISLLSNFKYSFLFISILLILAVVVGNNYIPGQQSIIVRHAPYDFEHGLTLVKSLSYNAIVSIIGMYVNILVIRKKEIY